MARESGGRLHSPLPCSGLLLTKPDGSQGSRESIIIHLGWSRVERGVEGWAEDISQEDLATFRKQKLGNGECVCKVMGKDLLRGDSTFSLP